MLKLFTELMLYHIHVSFSGLRDADCNVTTTMVNQAVGGCQLLEIWEQLHNFMNWCLQTIKSHKIKDHLHINQRTSQHILRET
jgi:hypothetical protein